MCSAKTSCHLSLSVNPFIKRSLACSLLQSKHVQLPCCFTARWIQFVLHRFPKNKSQQGVLQGTLAQFYMNKAVDTKENCAEREGGSPKLMLTPSFLDVDTAA